MKNTIKIAILGGGGRTGKYLVTQLLDQGYALKLLLRSPENFQLDNPLIEIIKGDAVDAQAIQLLLKDCQAVISTIGQRKGEPLVASRVTAHVLKSMIAYGIKRYILIAGLNVDTPFDKKGTETAMATEWMKNTFPKIQEDRQKAYSLLAASNLHWTMVRVPLIEFTANNRKIVIDLKDCKGTKIDAASIATFLIKQLSETEYIRKSPFIATI